MVQFSARNAVRVSKHLVSTDRIFVELLAVSILAIPALFFIQKRLASSRRNRALQTFHKFIDSYSSLDTAVLDSNLASTFTHVILPKSLNIPTRDLTTFKEHSEQIFDLFERFAVIPHHNKESVFYCEESEMVIAHCKMGGKLNRDNEKVKGLLEARMGEWWSEGILFVKMNGRGAMIEEVREFVDSKKADDFKERLERLV